MLRSTGVVPAGGVLEVLPAVELNGQSPSRAVEIENESVAGMLPTELEAGEAFRAQVSPQDGFSIGARLAKGASPSEQEIHGPVFGIPWRALRPAGADPSP